ncbi:LSM domain containing protein [Novymonas esmeraldas]|uniref:LSM domain containing protein n=1 Tax=Novymonas esmeraldas TaxID=1808958 RepID=A0AAW0EQB4_9TRYP
MAAPAGSDIGSSRAPTDPLEYLALHIHKRVAITLAPKDDSDDGAVVRGTLLSVDDVCNVLLRYWTSTDSLRLDGGARAAPQQRSRKRTRGDGDEDAGESVRLIRGAQIVSIALLPE